MQTPSPNPMNPPPLPHNRQRGLSDVWWFILGLVGVAAIIAAFTFWTATSSHSAEIDFPLLEVEVRQGTVSNLAISGHEVRGDFTTVRQSYDGQVRGRNEAVPPGYSESDARAVTEFTAIIPTGERDRLLELAEVSNVSFEVVAD